MPTYKLQCFNRSSLHGVFAVYQSPPDANTLGSVYPVAWLARPSAPNTKITFTWTTNWHFVWGEAGVLRRGAKFDVSQIIDCDPLRANMVDLAKDEYGSPMFQNLRSDGVPGTLTINQLNNVFDYPVSVGVGMAGAPSCIVKAAPNVTSVFVPNKTIYYVVFGSYSAGDVVDVGSHSQSLAVDFTPSTPNQVVALNSSNILNFANET